MNSNGMSVEPFNRLVKLAARAFYDDISTKGENQPKTGRSDNRGIAVVILDALTRRQWVREEDLAKDLKLHSKQLRRTLRFFEEEKLVTRDHRKETAKGAKIYSAAVAATADGQHGREGEEKIKLHTHSYCCLDYAQIYDVVRYRLHRMRKKLKDELENKNTVQEYICPNCTKRYTALDALRLVSTEDEYFHCESCNGELVAESDKLAAQEMGDGDDNARRRRREKLKDMLQKLEEQLKPLMDQLSRVKDLPVPEFGNLHAWELRAAVRTGNSDFNANDASRSAQGFGGTPMPCVGETKVEVAFSGVDERGEDTKSENSNSAMKVLPPWMIKQGMNLTKEQRGEVKEEMKMEGTSAPVDLSEDKKDKKSMTQNTDAKILQDEYVKAYYAAILQMQQKEAAKREQELSNTDISNGVYAKSDRQVGSKSKRDDNEGDEDIEWEEAAPTGNAGESYKVNDLNVEADASVDEDEDDIDWEEG
ncbi:transcription initiation factor IIE subunit alpha-like [Rhododendron vialii]|uniref:transcription initiation factor IIE subunit alpha-like n=1 Tax=Rhododendron vialii TaxID=182163 RepID=UPI00265E515F|nr:transcription initiation factor IIE subunit alpha-like [Rhododendron vialii]